LERDVFMEFRKLIGFGKSSFVVSLPKKWLVENNLEKGSTIALDINENILTLNPKTNEEKAIEKKEIDISNLDSSTILHIIQAAYKKGYDEVTLRFTNREVKDFKTTKSERVQSIISKTTERLVGFEIIKQSENLCILKDISSTSSQEFSNVLRRIFLLTKDMINSSIIGIEKKDALELENIQEKHDNITKFIAFCLRLLNKQGIKDYKKSSLLYHIISNIDKIADIYKYLARNITKHKININHETLEIIKYVESEFNAFYEIFYKLDYNKIVEFSRKRREARKKIETNLKNIASEEIYYASQQIMILDLLLDLIEATISIEL